MKRIDKYFSKHVFHNSAIHVISGIGIGVLFTHPLFDPHPLRWGLFFLTIGLLGHWFAYTNKK